MWKEREDNGGACVVDPSVRAWLSGGYSMQGATGCECTAVGQGVGRRKGSGSNGPTVGVTLQFLKPSTLAPIPVRVMPRPPMIWTQWSATSQAIRVVWNLSIAMGPASRVPRGPSFDLHMSYVMLSFMLCTLS